MQPFIQKSIWCLVFASICFVCIANGPQFKDVSSEAGVDFEHFNGMTGGHFLPEIVGSGCAWFDMDNDGDLDLYLVQGAIIDPEKQITDALIPWQGKGIPKDQLYRNDGLHNGIPKFTNITAASGIDARGIGMGVATGDVDNDGLIDLYITNLGSNQLWRNLGQGKFTDITAKAGVDDARWSTSAVFADMDRDGFLDLYVTNYVHFNAKHEPKCYISGSVRDYCGPQAYQPAGDRFFRNKGDGTFENATGRIDAPFPKGPGLGVVAGDFNSDGWPDLVVANDGAANFYWVSQGKNKYMEDGMFGGIAVNSAGAAEASMGIAVGDYDNDGDEDLFMTHLDGETNTLYSNIGGGLFEDRTNALKLGPVSKSFTGFGTVWLDLEGDGWLDLICLNGAVKKDLGSSEKVLPLQQKNQLFANREGRFFDEITDLVGSSLQEVAVSRGVAKGDFDNDGDVDLLITNNSGKARILLNQTTSRGAWLGLDLRLANSQRPAIGAQVLVHQGNDRKRLFQVRTDGSYLSAHDPRLTIGLGQSGPIKAVEITWPNGQTQKITDLALGTYHKLVQK